MLTTHNKYGIEAVKAGALDYILKPVSINELRAAIEKSRGTVSESDDDKISLF